MERMLNKTRPDYGDYMKRTNMFIPGLSKSEEGQEANFGWWLFALQSANKQQMNQGLSDN